MTKSGISEGEVCVSCDAVFDTPAHGTFFGELFVLFFLFASLQNKSLHGGKERAAVFVPSQVANSPPSETTASHRWTTMGHTLCCSETSEGIHLQSDVGYWRGTGQHSNVDFGARWITDRARRNAFPGREQVIDPSGCLDMKRRTVSQFNS